MRSILGRTVGNGKRKRRARRGPAARADTHLRATATLSLTPQQRSMPTAGLLVAGRLYETDQGFGAQDRFHIPIDSAHFE
jgi:hypothetical protein